MINRIILSFGSNLGNKAQNIREAVDALKNLGAINDIIISDIFHSKAVLIKGSPDEWDKDFYNIVLSASTHFAPLDFFDIIKKIEVDFGRMDSPKWSPRIIDIDILFYNDIVLDSEICTIPHKLALEREFVMNPLLQISPDYIYPRKGEMYGKSIDEIYKIKYTQKEKA